MVNIPINEKASNLIQYIKELSQLRQKPVSSYRSYEDLLWIADVPVEDECMDIFRDGSEELLYVRKPKFPVKPSIPASLKDWIIINKNEILVHDSILIEVESEDDEKEARTKEIFLKNFPDIINEINEFRNDKWSPYILEYRRVSKIQEMYDQLYKIHQLLQNNSETLELVLGVGLLQWKQKDKEIVERPLLISEVELHFNKEDGEMIILPTSKGSAFTYEEDMLSFENRLSGEDQKDILSLLEESYSNESVYADISGILTSIVNALSSRGIYQNSIEIPKRPEEGPIVSLSPVFIVRKKTMKSFQHACDKATEQLALEESEVPENLANMFGEIDSDVSTNDNEFRKAEEHYFPLPYNEEQSRIISQLGTKSSVLVQGPPGTGKTHTIANLTSHLLATGQKVLITSQTAKALSVLKSKLPPELQDLSVSLLGGDAAAMKDLEKVVSTISTNKERMDLKDLSLKVEQQEEQLSNLKQSLNNTKTELMEVREAETYIHNQDSYKGTAQEIAKQLSRDAALFDWYTTSSTAEEPFIKKEKSLVMRYLELLNLDMGESVSYKSYDFPTIDNVLEFNKVTKDIQEESELIYKHQHLIEKEDPELQKLLKGQSSKEIADLANKLNKYTELSNSLLVNTYPSLKKVVADIFENRAHLWSKVYLDIKSHIETIKANGEIEAHLFAIGDVPIVSLKKLAEDFMDHFSNGGKMGGFLLKPKIVKQYKEMLRKITHNNLPIKTEKQMKLLDAYAHSTYAYESIEKLMIPQLLEEKPFVEDLALSEYENCLAQLSIVMEISKWREEAISTFSFLVTNQFNEKMVSDLVVNIELFGIREQLRLKTNEVNTAIQLVENELTDTTHPLYSELITALKAREPKVLQSIEEKYEFYQRVVQRDKEIELLAAEIEFNTPQLYNAIKLTYSSSIWADRLNVWEKAQQWKRTNDWLQDFTEKDEASLSAKYSEIEKKISDTITEIGTAKAWISMLSRMTSNESKHLKAWALNVKNIGKGTGKNAPRYMAAAQEHMEKCKDAIPAWIMPLHRVFENFEIRPGLFDIVIVDEASQSWHDALLLKYLAKKMIIVGDKEQISPSVVGVKVEDIARLQNKHLKPIEFEFGDMLDASNSFFDVADVMFKETITLREHFRCMPEIIGFSNIISYSNKPLIPLRQYPANRLEPIISRYLPHGVREGSSQNAYNEVEADEIVKEIKNCIKCDKYAGKTIGVISLLGNNQAKLIQNKLIAELGPELMEERQIICGDAYDFQGDERDVIFLSMVAAKGATRVTALASDAARQRFNVAASRAKDQLWVMHSLSVNDISNRDCVRYQLLNYIANPFKEETEANRMKCESGFEENVFDAIVAKGYRVIPQYEVAGYRIDLVIQGEQSRLAVECDGDHWHTSVEDKERDFQRELLLQRAGWSFWRVLGSKYYHNPEKALESLWVKLDEMNIRPVAEWDRIEVDAVEETKDEVLTIVTEEVEMETEAAVQAPTEEEPAFSDEVDLFALEEKPTLKRVSIKKNDMMNKPIISYEQPSLLLQDELIEKSTSIQQDLFGLSEVENNMEKLWAAGFEAFVKQDQPDRIYVLGSQQLEIELARIAPKNNSFTYLEKGNEHTGGESTWYLDLDLDLNRLPQ